MEKWYYVTGTDTGFGAMAVRMLAEKKVHVFAGHFSPESAGPLEKDGNGYIHPLLLDVTKDETVTAAARKIEEVLQKHNAQLGGLVNNAGLLFQAGPAEWTPIKNWQIMYDVNVLGTVRVTNSVLPLLRKSEGRIVNTASIAGRAGLVTQSAYCASKFAVEGYSEVLRREIQAFGVTVHIVEPGVYATGLYQTFFDGLEKLWGGCTKEVQQSYGEEYKERVAKMAVGTQQKYAKINSNASDVPRAYLHALLDRRPQYKYRLGYDSRVEITLLSWMPSWMADTAGEAMTGVIIPAASSAAARRRAVNRYARPPLMTIMVLILVIGIVYARLRSRLAIK